MIRTFRTALVQTYHPYTQLTHVHPLGIMSLAASAREHGHSDQHILDMKVERWSVEEAADALEALQPDVIGLSAMTYEAGCMHELAREVKRRMPEDKIVCGGPHPSVAAEDVMADPAVDFVVRGEGEETFCELLDNLPETSPRRLHELMTEEGNDVTSVVWFLRMLTSGRIKAHADRFAPFIGDDFADVERFCQVEVESVNVECDQVQIIALTRAEIKILRRRPTRGLISAAQALTEALGVAVAIEYLDASGAPSRVVFPDGGEPSVTLLYRPGHYDILYDR